MSPMPKKPGAEKPATTLDDIIADQARQRDEASGVGPAASAVAAGVKKPARAKKKPAKRVSEKSKASLKASVKKAPAAPLTTPAGKGRPAIGEVLKNTQLNLPLDLIERIGRVAARLYAGNKSYFARLALEEAVSKAEKLIK